MNENHTPKQYPGTMTLESWQSASDDMFAEAWRREENGSATAGAIVGKLVGLTEQGQPLVQFAVNRGEFPLVARHVCALGTADVGRDVVLSFEEGDCGRPIIVGLLQPPSQPGADGALVNVSMDGQQITLSAKSQIVLRCGKASITLTRAGKVLIRGAYLLSRSSGVNRIKGGSVQIN
jgi:hypothetical protein